MNDYIAEVIEVNNFGDPIIMFTCCKTRVVVAVNFEDIAGIFGRRERCYNPFINFPVFYTLIAV
jgi:hypothetical protein